MNTKVEIEYWEDGNGLCPYDEFVMSLPVKESTWILKREDFFQEMSMEQLKRTPYFEKIKGVTDPIWELKYPGSGSRNYRALCIIQGNTVVVLEMFKGSGKKGIGRFLNRSIERAKDWRQRSI